MSLYDKINIMPSLRFISDSIKGTERSKNKDRVFVVQEKDYLLAVVFDGISSAENANEGISVAVNFIQQNYKRFATSQKFDLAGLMFEAHLQILKSGLLNPFSTFSALWVSIDKEHATFSNLGDSRVYEVTPQYIKQLSKDDNLSHNKNVVTRYLGMPELDRSDFQAELIDIKNKRVLLCSDGFYFFIDRDREKLHSVLNYRRGGNIKKNLLGRVSGINTDDSSYLFLL